MDNSSACSPLLVTIEGILGKNTPLSRPHLEPQPTIKQRTILFPYSLISKSQIGTQIWRRSNSYYAICHVRENHL